MIVNTAPILLRKFRFSPPDNSFRICFWRTLFIQSGQYLGKENGPEIHCYVNMLLSYKENL